MSKSDRKGVLLVALGVTACGAAGSTPSATVIEIARVDSKQELFAPERDDKASSHWVVKGTFKSTIWSDGVLEPGETELSLSDTVGEGRYSFSYAERRVEGTLEDCHAATDREWTCRWFDQFGRGSCAFRFDAEFRSFEGEWWIEDDPDNRYAWTGMRMIGR